MDSVQRIAEVSAAAVAAGINPWLAALTLVGLSFLGLVDPGAIPLIAYFPGRQELLHSDGEQTAGQRIMKEIGVPFVDTTPCILEVGPDAGYVPNDTHYSPAGNEAVAKCLGAALSRILAEDKAGQLGSTQR